MSINPEHFTLGHVRPVKDPAFLERIASARRDSPALQLQIDALRALGSEITFLRKIENGWIALVRFGRVLEGNFARNRELLLYISLHHDLQLRDFQRLPAMADSLTRKADPEIYLVSSPDLRASEKLQDWSARERFSAIAMPRSGTSGNVAAAQLYAELAERLAARNLYEETLPVTGMDFFGREPLLVKLQDRLREGKVCGVFGLRKTGKTSILKELGRRFEDHNKDERIFILRDLENLSGNASDHAPTVQADITGQLLTRLRQHGIRTYELANLSTEASLGDFRRALQASLSHATARDKQIVLAIDEVESLIGDSPAVSGDRPHVPEFFGALRSLVQENHNFNVMLAGITDAVLHEARLAGRENPLFAWAIPYYASPMSRQECDVLVVKLGRRMALEWHEQALEAVYSVTEGHVFLHRSLCTLVASDIQSGTERVISADRVLAATRTWRRSVAEQVSGMMGGLERYYPGAHTLHAMVLEEMIDLTEADAAYPSELHQLIHLGLLREEGDRLVPTAFSRLAARG